MEGGCTPWAPAGDGVETSPRVSFFNSSSMKSYFVSAANINAARDDDGPSVGAILVVGALSGIAAASALSYLSSDGTKQVIAPPPKNTCDNPKPNAW